MIGGMSTRQAYCVKTGGALQLHDSEWCDGTIIKQFGLISWLVLIDYISPNPLIETYEILFAANNNSFAIIRKWLLVALKVPESQTREWMEMGNMITVNRIRLWQRDAYLRTHAGPGVNREPRAECIVNSSHFVHRHSYQRIFQVKIEKRSTL